MEDLSLTVETEVICTACNSVASPNDAFCNSCGYPIKGTEQEQISFMAYRNNNALDLEDQGLKINQATTALKWVGGLTIIGGVISYFTTQDEAEKIGVLLTYIILGAIYFGLGLWSKKKPMAAILTGFTLYILVITLSMIVDPATILQGIILKVIIIGAFVRGIRAVIEAERIKKEHNL